MGKKILKLLLVCGMFFSYSNLSMASSSVKSDDILKDTESLIASTSLISSNNNSLEQKVNELHIKLQNSDVSFDDPNYDELIANLEKLDNLVSPTTLARAAKTWRYGDILIYTSGNKNAIGEKSLTGHTAVLSTTNYNVIEASKTKSNGAKVYHWNRTNLWSGASGIIQLKVTNLVGKNATTDQRKKAVNYGLKQKGKPYALKTTLNDTSKWYCSKLTYKMWKDAGYDVSGKFVKGVVTPNNILLDANIRVVKSWKSSLPGMI